MDQKVVTGAVQFNKLVDGGYVTMARHQLLVRD